MTKNPSVKSSIPSLSANSIANSDLYDLGLVRPNSVVRLHLGCGQYHLDGYVNVDYPPSEHTVQGAAAADVYADITTLRFTPGSVSEVRLHHVFEHFDRPTALALLCQWHAWLKPGGTLIIETPDFEACVDLLKSPEYSYSQKQVVVRHVFGSHEARWAVHWDGWYEEKYRRVLGALGYSITAVEKGQWLMTRNITIRAVKSETIDSLSLRSRVQQILSESLLEEVGSERDLLAIWMERYGELTQLSVVPQAAPTVSIFIPAFNRETYLAETLDSLLAQSFTDFEIVVADDGSSDGTLEMARAYAARDARIRVLSLPHNGEVAARNSAIRETNPSSKYLINHDSDDVSLPNKLQTLVSFLESHPEVSVVGSYAQYFNDAGEDLGVVRVATDPKYIRKTFARGNPMLHSATLFRREVFTRIGAYREERRFADDYDLFCRALLAGFELANIPEVLHKIRIHPTSLSSTIPHIVAPLAKQIQDEYRSQYLVWRIQAKVKRRLSL